MKSTKEFLLVALLSVILVAVSTALLTKEEIVPYAVLTMAVLPLLVALWMKLSLKRLIPDFIFGAIDTGLLTVFAIAGGQTFGVIGAVVGGVVGDAITDGIAGFFEGNIAEWLRNRGVDESRLPLSSGLGKMAGCLLGSGVILIGAALVGIHLPKVHM